VLSSDSQQTETFSSRAVSINNTSAHQLHCPRTVW